MHYVYLIQSQKDKSIYTGYTSDIKKRLIAHNSGQNISTKKHAPYELIYVEGFINKKDALGREKYLKSGYGKRALKSILRNYFEENQ